MAYSDATAKCWHFAGKLIYWFDTVTLGLLAMCYLLACLGWAFCRTKGEDIWRSVKLTVMENENAQAAYIVDTSSNDTSQHIDDEDNYQHVQSFHA